MDVRNAQLFVFEYMLRNVNAITEAARLMCALYADYFFSHSPLFWERARLVLGTCYSSRLPEIVLYMQEHAERALVVYDVFHQDAAEFLLTYSPDHATCFHQTNNVSQYKFDEEDLDGVCVECDCADGGGSDDLAHY